MNTRREERCETMEVGFLIFSSLIFMVIGVPIGVALILGMVSSSFVFGTVNIQYLAQGMYNGLNSLPFIAIPTFMLAGSIMEAGGLSKRLVRVANCLVGNMTGGLGSVAILACLFFGAVSGSAPATAAAIGGIMIPEMVKAHYDKDYSAALCAVSGGLGIVMPPSIPFVVFGCAVSVSIGDLFVGGILPAILIALCLMIVSIVRSKMRGYTGTGNKFNWHEFADAMKDGVWALLMPIIILGGIYGGIFTPTEAAVVSLIYGLLVSFLIYKELTMKRLYELIKNHVSFTGGILLPLAGGLALGAYFSLLNVPQMITDALLAISTNKYIILLLINVFLIGVGMLLDAPTAIVILAPILVKALAPYNINPIHLGVMVVCNLALGLVTPPVAANLFVASGITGLPMEKIVKQAMPFILALVFAVLLITFVPAISLLFVGG